MDFHFSPEEEAFRQEVRDFIRTEAPEGWRDGLGNDPARIWQFEREWQRKLAARRWLALAWPKELGGYGATYMEQLIFNEEMGRNRAPSFVNMGVAWVAPSIMLYGSYEQKQRYVRRIAEGEDIWCTLYSEPGAGSDLASLQTRAELDGDEWVINGQKIWTTYAHLSDHGWLAARTDPTAPKHRGISTFVVPMRTPGITVQPLVNMADGHEFNEVFFEDVRIPRENLVGELNRGWYHVAVGFGFERTSIGNPAGARRAVQDLAEICRRTMVNGRPLAARPEVRMKIADLWTQIEVATVLAYRVASLQTAGKVPDAEASEIKLFAMELNQRVSNAAVGILGLGGQVRSGPVAARGGDFSYMYLRSVANTIEGGTSEIMRNIIATRGLGLPR